MSEDEKDEAGMDKPVVVALCAFSSLTHEQRMEFLRHAGDTFCLRCGDQTDGRTCYCDPSYDILD